MYLCICLNRLFISSENWFTMIRNSLFLFLISCFSVSSLAAQEVWSLEKCVKHAAQNNLNLRQAEIGIQQAVLDKKRAEQARYPNLNAQIDGGFNFGRTIDPTTNDFRSTRIGSSRVFLGSDMTVYNGGRINNTIKQSKIDTEVAKADAASQLNDISLNIASAYLNVLVAQEQAVIAQKQVAQTKTQLEQTDKRIQAGVLPQNERLEILAQQARNQQNLVAAENNVAINLISLKNFLELDPTYDLAVETPPDVIQYTAVDDYLTLESVYQKALETQPSITASELRMESANLNVEIAKADKLPSVALFGNINSNYAHIKDFAFNEGYFNQLDNNLGQTLGARINIPIYNRGITDIAIEQARLGILNADVANKQAKQQLQADVQNAIASAKAAKAQLDANQIALDAAKASFDNAQKMYDLGAINTLEYTNARTNLDTAELDVVRAKYEYVFRAKVIDFYLGKELTLK